MDLSSVKSEYEKIKNMWEGSLQKNALLNTIQRKLLSNETLQLDSAICLGLGSMEHARFRRDASPSYKGNMRGAPEIPDTWESDVSDDEPIDKAEAHNRLSKAFINPSLYQLIIFETTIEFLQPRFTFKNICFQDPWFTKADATFLEGKGYEVIPYLFTPVETEATPIDPAMLEHISRSTFFFSPALDIPIFAEVVCTREPSLILSENPLQKLGFPILPFHLLDIFEKIICPCSFANIAELGYDHFGFTWPLVLDNERALVKLESRESQAEELKCQRAKFITKPSNF